LLWQLSSGMTTTKNDQQQYDSDEDSETDEQREDRLQREFRELFRSTKYGDQEPEELREDPTHWEKNQMMYYLSSSAKDYAKEFVLSYGAQNKNPHELDQLLEGNRLQVCRNKSYGAVERKQGFLYAVVKRILSWKKDNSQPHIHILMIGMKYAKIMQYCHIYDYTLDIMGASQEKWQHFLSTQEKRKQKMGMESLRDTKVSESTDINRLTTAYDLILLGDNVRSADMPTVIQLLVPGGLAVGMRPAPRRAAQVASKCSALRVLVPFDGHQVIVRIGGETFIDVEEPRMVLRRGVFVLDTPLGEFVSDSRYVEPKHISKDTLFPAYRYFNIISLQLPEVENTRDMIRDLPRIDEMEQEEVVIPKAILEVFNAAVPLTEHDLVIEIPQDMYFMKEKFDGEPYVGVWTEEGVELFSVQGGRRFKYPVSIPTNRSYQVYAQYELVGSEMKLVTMLEIRLKDNLIATSEFDRFSMAPVGMFKAIWQPLCAITPKMEEEWEGIVLMRKTSSRNSYKIVGGGSSEVIGSHRYVKAKYTIDVKRGDRVYETTVEGHVIKQREKEENSLLRLLRVYQAVPFHALYAFSQVAETPGFYYSLLNLTQEMPCKQDAYTEHKMGMIHNPDVRLKVEQELNKAQKENAPRPQD